MTHCLWSTLLGLLSVLSTATSRSVRQLPSAYPPVLPTGYYGQPPYAYPPYGYGYQAPPPVYQPYYDNVFGVFKSYPGGGFPVRFDYNNRCSRNYIGIKPHPDQQQYYYVCKPDCVIFSKCRGLESFNASSGRCVQHVPQHRPDHRPPQCQKEGRFPHPHDCKVYYRCDKNRTQPWLFACPAGTIFSPVERKCLPGDQCPSTEISDSGSYIPQNCELKFPECAEEGTFRSPTDCALYYTCRLQESGTYLQTRFKCPGSNSFDLERKLCRPRSEVDCFDFVPGPVQVPYVPQPYYPPYPAAPSLYEEDDYDTGARDQQPALKSEKLQVAAQGFEKPSLNVVVLQTSTSTTSEPSNAYHKYPAYPSYPSYEYSSHHRGKETAAENLELKEEGVPRKLKLSENIVIQPETPATTTTTREPLNDTNKYQYKKYTYGTAKNDVTEAPEIKSPLKGLHLSQNIVILPTTSTPATTTTTTKPVVLTCPTIPTPKKTPKPSTTTATPKISSTEQHSTTTAKTTTTKRPTTVNEKTSPATEKPRTTVVTTTTQKRSTTTHNTSPDTKTTIRSTTLSPKTTTTPSTTTTVKVTTHRPNTTARKTSTASTTTKKTTTSTTPSTTTRVKVTTHRPNTTARKTSTASTTTKKTTTSPKTTKSTEIPTSTTSKLSTTTQKTTTTTHKSTAASTSTENPKTTTEKTSTVSTTTKKSTESSPKPTSSTVKPITTPKPSTRTTPTTTTVTATTQITTTTSLRSSTESTSTQTPKTTLPQPTKTTTRTVTPKISTTTTTTEKPITSSPKPTTTTQNTTSTAPNTTIVTITTQKETTPIQNTSTTRFTRKTTSNNPEPTSTEKSTTTPKLSTTTPKTSTVATSSEKTTISSPKPTTEKSTENPTTNSVKTSALTSSTHKATSTTSEPTKTTQEITTTTPKPTTLKTSTQEPTTSTQKVSTVTITTEKATESSPLTTLSTEEPTTTPKPLITTTPTTTSVTATTRLTTTTISKSTTESTSTQKSESTTPIPTTSTTSKATTVIVSTQNPTTSTSKTSTVTITTPKPSTSTQKSTTTTRQPTSVTTSTTSIGTTRIPTTTTPQNSTSSTDLTTVTRPPCPDPDSTSDKNTNPACTQELQQVNLLELQSPQKQEELTHTQTHTALTGSRNTLSGQEVPDYMDDAPSFAEAESGQATTAKAPTMSTLAAAHLLQKLFHIISTTPPSREHAPTQRPSSQPSSSQRSRGVTIAQMARHNLATSKPFIAHSLRLSIQQLASTQKRSIPPKTLVTHNTTKEPEDSEYYDSETSEQYADEDNEVLDKVQPKAMSSTTEAAVLPAAPSTTTEREPQKTSSSPSPTKTTPSTTSQPIETTTGDLEYDSSGGSDYVNDANDIPSGVATSLEARKNFLLSLLKQRLTRIERTESKKPMPATSTSTTTGAPQTTSSSTSPVSTTSESTSSVTSLSARSSLTASKHSSPEALSRQKSLTDQSAEYYAEDDDYMEDEHAGSSDAEKKKRVEVLIAEKQPAATAKRHVAPPSEQLLRQAMLNILATRSEENEVDVKATSDGLQFRRFVSRNSQIPTESPPNRASIVVAEALSRRLADNLGELPSGPTVPHTSDAKPIASVSQTTIRSREPQTESSSQTPPSTSTETPATQATQKHRTGEATQSTLEIVTQTTPESAPPATTVPVAVRQEVLSVNSRPWLLAARNQTVHLTPISSIAARAPSNPVSHANRSINPLVSSPEDHSTEKVPQLIVKVYEPIDLKIVFCPKSCDQDHDHKFDPADNIKTSNCTGGCDEEERIHKHVDIQWKPLELTDIAGFRNAV
ncbi:mucin-5AC isoform X1 [Drosophila sechellia]|uniref:mucin-5AC isoform X1 n=1 Tax=Drosophila sechellia TaxID=7238 RepID=UPI0013DDD096|nr:mucin-5AC isoform X1 [Drosophila sechellia]